MCPEVLDHEQQMTISGGAAYVWHGTRFSGDMLVGSGFSRYEIWREDDADNQRKMLKSTLYTS